MSADDLWEYTRNAWTCGPRREGARFALAVSYGIVRAGFEISGWREWANKDRNFDPGQKMRYVIESNHAPTSHPEMAKYVQKNVKSLINNPQWSFRYLNC